jgi:hypothetical protein
MLDVRRAVKNDAQVAFSALVQCIPVRKEIRCFDKDLPVALRKALRKAIHASTILAAEMKARRKSVTTLTAPAGAKDLAHMRWDLQRG